MDGAGVGGAAGVLGSGAPEQYARNFEEEIGANIDALRKKLNDAANTVGQQGRDKSTEALDKARELARGMDSMGQRMAERARQGEQGAKGANGANGAEGGVELAATKKEGGAELGASGVC